MYRNNRMQYVIKTCSGENTQELQNLLNEMSMNGWELYSMTEIETEDGFDFNCIFMSEASPSDDITSGDVINIASFKSKMEKMLSPELTPYEKCIDIQSKIATQQRKISKIKSELEGEAPASINRKKLNDKMSAGLKELDELKLKLSKAISPDIMFSRLKEDKLTINLSNELLSFVDIEKDSNGEDLLADTVKLRQKLTDTLGYVLPKIIFKDDDNLNPYEFSINVRGNEVARAHAYPSYSMFYSEDLHIEEIPSDAICETDEITGKEIIWLEKSKTKNFWEKGLSGSEYISKVLEYYSIKYVEDLLDYEDIDKYVDVVHKYNSFLVENIMPDFVNEVDIKYVLTNLIKEKVSIKNIVYIFEKLNDYAEDSPKSDLLTKLRLVMSKNICSSLTNAEGFLQVFEISESTLSDISPNIEDEDNYMITVDGTFAETLADKINRKAVKYNISNPILVVPVEFRQLLFTLLSNYVSNITVLAIEEISCNCPVEIIDEV